MSLPWVKLHTSLLDNEAYQRFSSAAQHTFTTCLMLAGKQDQGDFSGRLEIPNLGPIKIDEIAAKTKYDAATQKAALKELLAAKFLSRDLMGTFTVERFREKAAPLSTERTRRYRERHGNVAGTSQEHRANAPEVKTDAEVDLSSLRSEITAFSDFGETGGERFQRAAHVFTVAFSGAKRAEKVANYEPYYADTLAAMAGRGASPGDAWTAFTLAVKARSKIEGRPKPLFSSAKIALNYLPSRQSRNGKPARQRLENDRPDDELDSLLAAKALRERTR